MALDNSEMKMVPADATAVVSSIIALKNEKIITNEEARDALKRVPLYDSILNLK